VWRVIVCVSPGPQFSYRRQPQSKCSRLCFFIIDAGRQCGRWRWYWRLLLQYRWIARTSKSPPPPPSSGQRELGRRRLLVLLNEVFPKPVAVDDQAENGCRWRRWRRHLQRWWWFHLCPATWSGRIVDRWRHWRAALAALTVEVGRRSRWRWQMTVSFSSSRGPQRSSTVATTTVAMADSMDSGVVRSLIQARASSQIPRKKKPSD